MDSLFTLVRRAILFALLSCCILVSANAQTAYSYYKGKKQYYTVVPGKKYVLTTITSSDALKTRADLESVEKFKPLSKSLGSINRRKNDDGLDNLHWAFINYGKEKSARIADRDDAIVYEAPFFKTAEGKEVALSNLFYVKLRKSDDLAELEKMAKAYKVEIVGNNKFMPLWYTLSCTRKSKGNALEMANLFYESNKYAAAEPDLMSDDIRCVNDSFYSSQWALQKISWCSARPITTGCNQVVVAVLDEGVETNHPDLTNFSPISFDSESGTSPSQVLGSHGTSCAGIIGAASNNSLGVSGVAPNVQIMAISNSLVSTPNSRQARADGINFAWQNGAAIISNSWGSAVSYQIIDDAIELAVTNGRGGLGTLVVFATGNDEAGSIGYPSNNPNVIAVGATTSADKRASFSNYGTGIDVVAPGVNIYTTDRQGSNGYNTASGTNGNYTSNFTGTSAACPHVSGVLALILSVKPWLTQQQARAILESSTDKVGGYAYSANVAGQPNGTWNQEVGYGRINVYKALVAAAGIAGPDPLCSTGTFTIPNSSYSSIAWSSYQPGIFSINSTSGYATKLTGGGAATKVMATVSFGGCTANIEKPIHVGIPYTSHTLDNGQMISFSSTIVNNVCNLVSHVINTQTQGATGTSWQRTAASPTSTQWSQSSGNVSFYFYAAGQTATFRHTAVNVCGSNVKSFKFKSITCSTDPCNQYTLSPNPTKGSVQVSAAAIPAPCGTATLISREDIVPQAEPRVKAVYVYDRTGRLMNVVENLSRKESLEVVVSDLEPGLYIVKIDGGDRIETQRLVVEQ